MRKNEVFGIEIPRITSVSIVEAQQRKELRIAERVDGILRYLESKSHRLGTGVNFHLSWPEFDEEPTDAHLIYYDLLRHSESVGTDELTSLLDHLKERGYIKQFGFKETRYGKMSSDRERL